MRGSGGCGLGFGMSPSIPLEEPPGGCHFPTYFDSTPVALSTASFNTEAIPVLSPSHSTF
jgi:hypothetical protein